MCIYSNCNIFVQFSKCPPNATNFYKLYVKSQNLKKRTLFLLHTPFSANIGSTLISSFIVLTKNGFNKYVMQNILRRLLKYAKITLLILIMFLNKKKTLLVIMVFIKKYFS